MEKYIRLNDGHVMPMIGFGTYCMPCRITQHCVEQALEIGYRHIDTDQCYGNEHEVGLAVKASGLKREDVFVTTKLWGAHGYGISMSQRSENNFLSSSGVWYLLLISMVMRIASCAIWCMKRWASLPFSTGFSAM